MEPCLRRLLIDIQCNQLTGLTRCSSCHNNILLPADRIGHWQSGLALAQLYLRQNLTAALVMCF